MSKLIGNYSRKNKHRMLHLPYNSELTKFLVAENSNNHCVEKVWYDIKSSISNWIKIGHTALVNRVMLQVVMSN